jgi:hypothetical protein
MAAPDLGSKTTVSFGTSTLTTSVFRVMGASVNGISREVIPTSHLLTNVANTFLPSDRYDPGELTLSMQMHHAGWLTLMLEIYGTGATAPTTANTEVVTLRFGGAGTEDMTMNAFVTNTDFDIPDEGLMTCDMTFKLTGNVEFI